MRLIGALAVASLALVAAQVAAANQLRPTAADQARAKQAVLRLGDLPPIGGWKSQTPTASGPSGSSSSLRCKGYNPKTSDLVTTGHAASEYTLPGLDITNDVTLLASERMVQLDWRRSVVDGLLPCLGTAFEKGAGGRVRVLELQKLAFPAFAQDTAAYRLVFGMTMSGKPVRGVVDFLTLASGRAEISFLVIAAIGPASELKTGEAGLDAIDRRLAQSVGDRLFPPRA